MESIISTFHIDWKIIIAQAINFAVVFVVLYIFALKPLNKLMKERSEKISKGLTDSKKAQEILLQAKQESEQNIIKLRQISIESKKELGKELDQVRAGHLATIKEDNNKWVKERVSQMEIDKKALVESAKKEVIDLAMLATEKLMESKQDLNNL